MTRRRLLVAVYLLVLLGGGIAWLTLGSPSADARISTSQAGVGLFDPGTGSWLLRDADGDTASFFYGEPGDTPLMGDWNCDGEDTVGMYRASTGFVYVRDTNDFGFADRQFFYGLAGDIPIAGDWNNNGCDTLAIYRNGTVYLSNQLATGVAEKVFFFGVPGDKPFTGDFDGNGTTDIGLHRESTGIVYYMTVIPDGSVAATADQFFYGNPGDRMVAGDWNLNQTETVGLFRPSASRFYLRNTNSLGVADAEFPLGSGGWLPVAGEFSLGSEVTTTTTSTTTTTTTTTTLPTGGPLTIMPIGDSITQGATGWKTYRCDLDNRLDGVGASFDFVGGLSGPNGGGSYSCAFDQDHEGRWGKRVDEVSGDVINSVQARQPDVALIHLGTNDILQGQGAAGTASELQLLIQGIQGVNPDITIMVAQIIPCNPAGGNPQFGSKCTSDLPALNEAIGSFGSLSTGQSTVVVVDMENGFSLSDLRDDVHPTDTGDQVIAGRWMSALQSSGVL
ncbi:MAG: SGNH/GDSL hydrolase family protein [Acidimicrobiia bacterium]|nr:SGNH/GDSL hydrolase family protein [Acidimicrobiia bacterium]